MKNEFENNTKFSTSNANLNEKKKKKMNFNLFYFCSAKICQII